MWVKPSSWVLKDQLYVTPEGMILRPIATIEEARHFNSIAVLTAANTLHIAVGRDLAEYDVKYNGSLPAIFAALAKVHGQQMVYTSADGSNGYQDFAPSTTFLAANTIGGTTPSMVDPQLAARVTSGRRWRSMFSNQGAAPKALFALLTNAISGSGFFNYGAGYYGNSDGSGVAGHTSVTGFGSGWRAGLTTVHKYMLDCSFATLLDKIGDHVENKEEAEVQEKMLAAAADVKEMLGEYANAQAFLFLTHFTAANNQTAYTTGLVKPVRAEYLQYPWGHNGGSHPMMVTDYFGAMEWNVDGRYETIGSIGLAAGDSGAFQLTPVALIAKDGSRLAGGYGLSVPAENHARTPSQLNTQSAPYGGQTTIRVSRALEILDVPEFIGNVPSGRIFGAIASGYVNEGTTVASSSGTGSLPVATLFNFCFDYGGVSSVARASGLTDEMYYASLDAVSPNPMRQFPLIASLSHGIDVVSVVDIFRMALKDGPPSWDNLRPYIGIYGRRELAAYGVPIIA